MSEWQNTARKLDMTAVKENFPSRVKWDDH